jgi:hypothetical protein
MGKAPRPFEITLAIEEAAHIMGPAGEGGHQDLHEKLNKQLEDGNLTIKLTDAELGMIIRYMTQYGSGGFQGRLRRAFWRPITEIFAKASA